MGDAAPAWHVLMPPRGVRTSFSGSDSGARRTSELGAGFDADGTVNAQIADKAASTFWSYDTESKGSLDRADLVSALGDMGALQGLPPKTIADTLALDSAANRDKRFTLHEFLTMYMRLAQLQAKLAREGRSKVSSQMPEPPPGAESNPALRQVFGAYCQFARGTSRMMMSETSPAMVAQQLHRLSQDIGLVGEGGPLYSSSVDIAYVRCKTPGSHRLNYIQWLKALCILSDESGWDLFQLLAEHAHKLGTKGLPPPVDPQTMLPPKPGMQVAPLPRLRHSTSGSDLPPPRPPSNAGNGLEADGPALWAQTMPAPSGGGLQGFRGRPSSGMAQRPPRFNTLMSGNPRDSWPPPGDVGAEPTAAVLADPVARSLSGEKSWTAMELGQLDPNCLPPWLSQVLERLQFMEARANGQQSPGNGARTYPYRPGRGGLGGAAGADDSDTTRALHDTIQDLQRQLQGQRAESDALQRRLQQLEAKAGSGPGGYGGGGYGSAGVMGSDLESRLARCEARLDGHDADLARMRVHPPGGQPLDARMGDVEQQLKTFSVSLLATATSAASAADSAGQALTRLEGLERKLASGEGVGAGVGVSPEAVAAASRSAPSQQQLLSMGLEPKVAEQVGRLPGLGLDAQVWADLLKRLACAEADTKQVDQKLKQLISNPAQVVVASKPGANGMPSAAVQQMLASGMDPHVVEQLAKLEALGIDPTPFAKLMRKNDEMDQDLAKLTHGPAAMAAAAAAAKQQSPWSLPSAAEQQMLAAGLDPKVVEQLGKLEAIGVDPLVFADLMRRQGATEQEVKALTSNPAAAAAAAQKAAAGGALSPALQQLLAAGVDPKVVEKLGKLEALGVDPVMFADLVKKQSDMEKELAKLMKNPVVAAAAAAAAAKKGGKPSAKEQQMLAAGLDPKVVEQLAKLEAIGVDPLLFADLIKRQGDTEQAVDTLAKNPAAAAAAAAAAERAANGGALTPAQQQMIKAGMDPKAVEELGKLEALGVDPLMFADMLKRLGATEGAVERLLKSPAAAAAAAKQASGAAPSAAEQQMLAAGIDPKVAEQLAKLEAIGVDPLLFADLVKRQGDTEQAVDKLSKSPMAAAPASAAQKAAQKQMVAAGVDPKVAEQLAKLGAIGVDPLLFADLVKRQGDTEQAVDKLLANPAAAAAAAAAAAKAANGGAPTPAQKAMLDAGIDAAVVEELGKLETLGVDPGVFGSIIRRVDGTEQVVDQIMLGPAGAATTAAAARRASGGAPSPAEQQMLAAGLDPKVVEQLGKLEAIGIDPLLFADLLKRVEALEEAMAKLGPAAAGKVDGAELAELRGAVGGMQQALASLAQEAEDVRHAAGAAQAAGNDAALKADALAAFAEALASKHDALESEVRGVRVAAAAAAGDDASKADDVKSLANAIAELGGRCTAMERDLAMALTSYARIVDLKESENHVLDRHQQLHDEIETLKDNLRTVHDEVEQLTAAVVVAAPTITNTQSLPGVIKQSVIMQPSTSSGNIGRPEGTTTTSSTPSRAVSKVGFPTPGPPPPGVPMPPR